jgi:hypothetical protein
MQGSRLAPTPEGATVEGVGLGFLAWSGARIAVLGVLGRTGGVVVGIGWVGIPREKTEWLTVLSESAVEKVSIELINGCKGVVAQYFALVYELKFVVHC